MTTHDDLQNDVFNAMETIDRLIADNEELRHGARKLELITHGAGAVGTFITVCCAVLSLAHMNPVMLVCTGALVWQLIGLAKLAAKCKASKVEVQETIQTLVGLKASVQSTINL